MKAPKVNASVGSRRGNGLGLEPSGNRSRTPSRSTVPSIRVISSVLRAGALRSGSTRYFAISAPSNAIAAMATSEMMMSWSQGEATCIALRPSQVANAVKAPTVSTSPCENLITSSTPKNSVKPTATRPYMIPSMSPLIRYWPNSVMST